MNASGLWQSAAGLFDAGLRQARQAFGYDAVDTGEGKRRAPSGVTRSEDDELPAQKRRKLLSQTRDLARNFALLGWAIRQHLNYITTFNFQPKTGNRRLNQKLAAFLENWSEPENFDVAGITPLWNFIRLAEVRRCIDGDRPSTPPNAIATPNPSLSRHPGRVWRPLPNATSTPNPTLSRHKPAVPPESDHRDLSQRIDRAVRGAAGRWVLIGGPPCQAYSVVGRSRNKGKVGYQIETDHRSSLYKQYLRVRDG